MDLAANPNFKLMRMVLDLQAYEMEVSQLFFRVLGMRML